MAITRVNQFTAKVGAEQELYSFLKSVIAVVEKCPGCFSCRLLQGAEDSAQLAVIEEWDSIDSHKAAAAAIPPEMLSVAMALFARPPVGTYYKK